MQTNDHLLSVRLGVMESLLPAEYDLFSEIRGDYLFDPEKTSGKVTRTMRVKGIFVSVTAKYQFSSRHPSWRLTLNGKTVQHSVCRNGQLLLTTLDDNGEPHKEESYNIGDDSWTAARYFQSGAVSAEIALIPGTKSLLLSWKDPQKASEKLTICTALHTENEALCRAVANQVGEPAAALQMQSGIVFCYPEEQMDAVRNSILHFQKQETKASPSADGLPSADEALLAALTYTAPQSRTEQPKTAAVPLPDPGELWQQLARPAEKKAGAAEVAETRSAPVEAAAETVQPAESVVAEAAPEEIPEPEAAAGDKAAELPQPGVLHFGEGENERCIEYDAQGNLLYAGGIRAGEHNGEGIVRSAEDGSLFVGASLYGGRHGLKLQKTKDQRLMVCFEDTALNTQAANAVSFSPEGELLYAGMQCGVREGFGLALLTPDGKRYVGSWHEGLPDGNGMLLDGSGALLYCGSWKNGVRCGTGTEYADGLETYRGDWQDDRRNGEGTFRTKDGKTVLGTFLNGQPHGNVRELAADGTLLYTGEMRNGLFDGQGTLFLPDGGRITGSFAAGAPDNPAERYDASGKLIYRGGFDGQHYSGRGTLLADGVPVYEGNFANGVYSGSGKLLSPDGKALYAGNFRDGKRCGIGAQFSDEQPLYFGQWENDQPNGCGIRYAHGKPELVGNFSAGKPQGRINFYRTDGTLLREALCENGEPVYMVEYSAEGAPVYAGAVHNGLRNGMGRMLNAYGECDAQGIFSNGALVKPVQTMTRTMLPLPCPEELRDTDYGTFALVKEHFVLDIPYQGGLYSGRLLDALPDGKGTLLFSGHCYTGLFAHGEPCGEGKLYLSTGQTIRGRFGQQDAAETLVADDRSYSLTRFE